MTETFPHRTPALLKVDSDWGSVVLLTSDALIERDPGFMYPSDVHFTGTQLFVGTQLSFRPRKRTLPFIILNNGNPVCIITVHGDASSGTDSEMGNVTVEVPPGGSTLHNDENNGYLNVKLFWMVPLPH